MADCAEAGGRRADQRPADGSCILHFAVRTARAGHVVQAPLPSPRCPCRFRPSQEAPCRGRRRPRPSPRHRCAPLDVLAEVFAYAPHAARLRAISLVCKRWRTAALRSIKNFVAGGREDQTPKMLASALALFPSLTCLELRDKIPFFALPTTLRKLSMWPSYLEASVEEEARGGTTYLSQHFPNLTALAGHANSSLHAFKPLPVSLDPLVRFLRAHSTHITEFTAAGLLHETIARDVAALPWPKLRKLITGTAPLSLWNPLPALAEIDLRRAYPSDFMAVAEHWLPLLTELHIQTGVKVQPVIDRLRRCTALTSLTAIVPRHCLERDLDLFRRVLDSIDLDDCEDWESWSQFKAVRFLSINPPYVAPPSPLPLPLLEEVFIGDSWDMVSAFDSLVFAIQLLRACPTIRIMKVYLVANEDGEDSPTLAQLIEELVALGVSVGLQSLAFVVDEELNLGCAMPRAAQLGWLHVAGLPEPC